MLYQLIFASNGSEALRLAIANPPDLILGDEAVVTEIVDMFFADAPRLLDQWRGAVASGDGDAARRATHTLKGTSASIGAVALARCCADAEALLRAGSLEGGAALLDSAVELLAQTATRLR